MTNPAESAAARPDREESVIEWFQSHGRAVGIGAAVVVVAAAGYWFYNRSVELKNEHADRMLGTALQSVQAGNAALAQSDLQKVVDGYRDTYSGVQAALTLAELDYDTGKPADGIKVLEGMTSAGGAAESNLPSIYSLMGDGYLQSGKAADAAKAYQKAADAANSDQEKAWQLAKAARAYGVAGDTANARTIWAKLASDPKAQGIQSEAQVRLGELEAAPAPKG